MSKKILIIGTNDIATASAQRLFRSGFAITMVSQNIPTDLYYFRNFSSVIATGSRNINNIKAQTFADFIYHQSDKDNSMNIDDFIEFTFKNRKISVLSESDIKEISTHFDYCIICDAHLFESVKIDTSGINVVSCVSQDYEFSKYKVITSGPHLGLVDYPYSEYKNREVADDKIVEIAASEGVFIAEKLPGDKVRKNDKIATIGDSVAKADSNGIIAGIMRSGVIVPKGHEIVCISNKLDEDVKVLPQNSNNISGGVLEAVLYDINLNNEYLLKS